MKTLILSAALSLFGLFSFTGNSPANYPAVNGVRKKIELPNKNFETVQCAFQN